MAEIQQGPLLANLRTLEREIGYSSWGGAGDPTAVLCAWTRLLANTVGRHAFPQIYKYGDKIGLWCEEIVNAPDHGMVEVCQHIHDSISEIDNDDGWPTDRAGYTLNAVCLCATYGIDPGKLGMGTRWPAEASSQVWEFATGSARATRSRVHHAHLENGVAAASLRAGPRAGEDGVMMTDDEAVARLLEIHKRTGGDPESHHAASDDFLVTVLEQTGYPKLAETYSAMNSGWWYA